MAVIFFILLGDVALVAPPPLGAENLRNSLSESSAADFRSDNDEPTGTPLLPTDRVRILGVGVTAAVSGGKTADGVSAVLLLLASELPNRLARSFTFTDSSIWPTLTRPLLPLI